MFFISLAHSKQKLLVEFDYSTPIDDDEKDNAFTNVEIKAGSLAVAVAVNNNSPSNSKQRDHTVNYLSTKHVCDDHLLKPMMP